MFCFCFFIQNEKEKKRTSGGRGETPIEGEIKDHFLKGFTVNVTGNRELMTSDFYEDMHMTIVSDSQGEFCSSGVL